MTAKMGRNEWVKLVASSLAGGNTSQEAMKIATDVIDVANQSFGSHEELAAKDDEEALNRIERLIEEMNRAIPQNHSSPGYPEQEVTGRVFIPHDIWCTCI